ncbi:MAG: hypothetical protein ACR2PS_10435, partial [Pseudomonadales bacterium]
YRQRAANYFARQFAVPQLYQTSDSDLGGFTGHSLGLRMVFLNSHWPTNNTDYDIGVNYYDRSDGIDMAWLTVGFSIPY